MLITGKLLDNYDMRSALDELTAELNSDNKYIIRFEGNIVDVPEITERHGNKVFYNESYDGHRDKITEKLNNTNFKCHKVGERSHHTYVAYQNITPVTMKQFISEAIELNLISDIIELDVDRTTILKAIEK